MELRYARHYVTGAREQGQREFENKVYNPKSFEFFQIVISCINFMNATGHSGADWPSVVKHSKSCLERDREISKPSLSNTILLERCWSLYRATVLLMVRRDRAKTATTARTSWILLLQPHQTNYLATGRYLKTDRYLKAGRYIILFGSVGLHVQQVQEGINPRRYPQHSCSRSENNDLQRTRTI